MTHRRFLNFVVKNYKNGVYSLRRLDLWRQPLFFPETAAGTVPKKLNLEKMESIKIPAPSIRFCPNPSPASVDLPYRMHCYGLSENKVVCTDNSGLSFLYDAGRRAFVTMPSLHAPKQLPISFAVPGGSSLYVMEQVIYPHYPQKGLFESFAYTTSETESSYTRSGSWHRLSLPPPPFVLDTGFVGARIHAYAVLGGGSHLCISSRGIGTYCFDTATREWSRAGNFALPFVGKAEYIPELNLWFGLSERDLHPCTSDLSSVLRGRKPILSNIWRRSQYPPEWELLGTPKLVNLGSGRLCILNYLETLLEHTNDYGDPISDQTFAVCTGVELLASCGDVGNGDGIPEGGCTGDGKRKRAIRMTNHMSKLIDMPPGYTTINAVL